MRSSIAHAVRRYDLFAVDLDGTLLARDSTPSVANVAALHAAREAGMRVVVCTGRGLVECAHILEAIAQVEPVVVAGGSIIADPVSRRTLHRAAIDQSIVAATVESLLEHRHAALVLKDPVAAGYDYLVVRGREQLGLDPVTEWWFASMNVRVRVVDDLDEDPHPEHTVRVGACGRAGAMSKIRAHLTDACAGRAFVHHFPAVVAPEHASRQRTHEDDDPTLHVLEVFDPRANKWDALLHLAREYAIEPSRIAAIGDEINDVAMIAGAGLGIAMGNAVPAVRAAAKRTVAPNHADGVAEAVANILSGAW
jgi:hydroxymethylpyrimidine pyrophosphatase-like HAD family hydrolase